MNDSRATHLFVDGEFTAHSGGRLPYKIDCDALTEADLNTLAAYVARSFPRFGAVYGIPRGGVRFESALRKYATHSTLDPILIVDDVLTTGASMQEARDAKGPNTFGVAIFARGACPDWITPLFSSFEARGAEIARLKKPHPWYGPCDALGPDGQCAECMKSDTKLQHPLTGTTVSVSKETGRIVEIKDETSEYAFSIAQRIWYEKIYEKVTSPGVIISYYAEAIDTSRAEGASAMRNRIIAQIESICKSAATQAGVPQIPWQDALIMAIRALPEDDP